MPKTGKYKVYYYYCKPTDMYYIGYTSQTLAERAGEYFEGYNRYMQADLYEYGYDAWECGILHWRETKKEAKHLEIEEAKKHNSYYPNGYNIQPAGGGGNEIKRYSKAWDHSEEICKRYKNGKSIASIAKMIACDRSTVAKILLENKFRIKGNSESQLGFDISEHSDEICEFYKNGETLKSIAKDFDCDPSVIRRTLVENNIKIRTQSEERLGFDISEHADEICRRYIDGEVITPIAKDFDCDPSVIRRTLVENNIKIRTQPESLKLYYQKKRKLKSDSIHEKQQSFF